MGSFCKYSFLASVMVWHQENVECRLSNGGGLPIANCRLRSIDRVRIPGGPGPSRRFDRVRLVMALFPTGFVLASFFRGHFFVSPYAASRYVIFNWVRLVLGLFSGTPVLLLAKRADPALASFLITSRALGGRMIAERSLRRAQPQWGC